MSLPLADAYRQDHAAAKEAIPATDAAAFLADPDKPTPPRRPSFAAWLGVQAQFEGPPPEAEDEDAGPRPDLFAAAYAQYIRDTWPDHPAPPSLSQYLGTEDTAA